MSPLYQQGYDIEVNTSYGIGRCDLGYIHQPASVQPFLLSRVRSLWHSERFLAKTLVCNSTWTQEGLKRRFGLTAKMVFPPVAVQSRENVAKEEMVVGLGRISSDKNWEDLIKIARLVQKRKKVRFVILGAASETDEYYLKIKALSKSDVDVLTNISENRKWEILSKAKVLLHTKRAEHFGISIVEAMSVGCIPVINSDGGAWQDILERGKYGYGYTDIGSAVDSVFCSLDEDNMSRLVKVKAQEFSERKFKQRFIEPIGL